MSTDTTEGPTGGDGLQARELAASLTVKDVRASIAWYRDVLGFTVEQEHERDGVLRAASMRAGSVRLLLGQDDGAKGWDRVKGEGFSLRFSTDQNVDALAARVRAHGGVFDTEPFDMRGMRAFRLRDPDGFRLTISSGR